MKRLITVFPNGGFVALHSRDPHALALHKLGKAVITRTTDIQFDAERQKWFAVFLEGEFKGEAITFGACVLAKVSAFELPGIVTGLSAPYLLFETDTDAIAAEHMIVEGLRRKGYMLVA